MAFSHRDSGTREEEWGEALGERAVPPLDLGDVDALLVVAAHPDDESLGAAGLIRRLHADGRRVEVLIATDGEGSHPASPTTSRVRLATMRREEAARALSALGTDLVPRFAGLPDGALREHRDDLAAAITGALERLADAAPSRTLVVAPWIGDGHRDHRVTGEVTAEVIAGRGVRHLGYPIWLWHWGSPSDVPWERSVVLTLRDDEADAKRRAIAAHASQIAALSDHAGDEAIVPERVRAHFERGTEVFVTESPAPKRPRRSLDASWFDSFYQRNGDDPWGFASRWYEERKRALLLAALPRRELGDVLEIGCSIGILTRALASRARTLLALDPAEVAVRVAGGSLAEVANVTVRQGSVPDDWPAGVFDTIVFSEVGYYLDRADLARAISLMAAALAPEGCLIACHWRHPVAAYPQTGDAVHEALRAHGRWESTMIHEERDLVLETFQPPSARSVAQREGLVP